MSERMQRAEQARLDRLAIVGATYRTLVASLHDTLQAPVRPVPVHRESSDLAQAWRKVARHRQDRRRAHQAQEAEAAAWRSSLPGQRITKARAVQRASRMARVRAARPTARQEAAALRARVALAAQRRRAANA